MEGDILEVIGTMGEEHRKEAHRVLQEFELQVSLNAVPFLQS